MSKSLRQHYLQQEFWVFGVIVLFLIAATSLLIHRLQSSYLEQTRTEINQLDGFFAQRLDEYQSDLYRFAQVPLAERTRGLSDFLVHFEDLVALNESGEVIQLYKQAKASFLFEGFQYPDALFQQLAVPPGEVITFYPLIRGFERDEPSIYFYYEQNGERLLARSNLQPLINFVDDYTDFSSNPVVLMNAQGVVIHSTLPGFAEPAVSLDLARRALQQAVRVDWVGESWLVLVAGPNQAGLKTLLLLPNDFLRLQWVGLVLLFLGTLMVLIALLFLRIIALRKDVLAPIQDLLKRLELVQQGAPVSQYYHYNLLAEFKQINSAVLSMNAAIMERTEALKQSKQDIEDREHELSKMLNSIPIAIGSVSLADPARILFVNDVMVSNFGYSMKHIQTLQQWAQLMHPKPAVRDQFLAKWALLSQSDELEQSALTGDEYQIRCFDGTLRDVLFNAVRLQDEIILSLTDIAAHKQSLVELETIQQKQQRTAIELLQNVPMGTYTMLQPADGGIAQFSFVSDQFLKFLGLTREEALQDIMTAFRCIHPDDLDSWVALNVQAFNERTHFYGEVRVVLNDTVRWVIAESIPRARSDGSVIWEGVLFDITDRKLAEQRLAKEQAQLSLILAELPLPIMVINHAENAQLHLLNHLFSTQFGYHVDDLTPLHERLSQFTEAVNLQERVLGQKQPKPLNDGPEMIEFEIKHREGDTLIVLCSVIEVGTLTLFAFVDISQMRETEATLLEAKNRAEQLEQAKSDFLAAMSHEIRTPLTSILGLTELMRQQDDISQKQAHTLERISAASDTLMKMLNDILDFSKLESGDLVLESRAFSLNELLRRSEFLHEWQAQEKGLELKVERVPEAVDWVLGDELRLGQVFNNLVHNAIKFSSSGAVQLSVHILKKTPRILELEFLVIDEGLGIEPKNFMYLLEPFTQSESGIARRFGGTGLGLPICKRLLMMMGSELVLLPRQSTGTTLGFTLKLQRAPKPKLPLVPPIAIEKNLLKGRSILVADDSDLIQEWLYEVLVSQGAWVVSCRNGASVIQYISEHPHQIDLILMDIQMPEVDGITATQTLRQTLGLTEIPILGFTAGLQTQEQDTALAAGMNEILVKPIAIHDLLLKIKSHLTRYEEEGSLAEFVIPTSPTQPTLPEVPGISLEHAMMTMDGNVPLFWRMLKLFAQDLAQVTDELERALANQDHAYFFRRLHQLKGGARQVGALELSDTVAQLETINQPDSKRSRVTFIQLQDQIQVLLSVIQNRLD